MTDNANNTNCLALNVKFQGQSFCVTSLGLSNTILDLRNELHKLTHILPENQKLLGLKTSTNEAVNDSLCLASLALKPNTKIMLVGSTAEAIKQVNSPSEYVPDLMDDFDFKDDDVDLCNMPENLDKVARRCKAYRLRRLAPLRPGKRLLVLDIDYTIFDHMSPAESARQLARPYLYEFLARAYVDYDIAIWSATSSTWILAKLGQLGVIPSNAAAVLQRQVDESVTDADGETPTRQTAAMRSASDHATPSFQICLLLDSTDMISVHFADRGVKEVKPLAVIWNNHKQWGPHNSIMFDDVRRNFVMNPQSGLRVRSYRDAHINHATDHELQGLATYLELIASREPDFTKLQHNRWERYVEKYRHLHSRKSPSNQHLEVTQLPVDLTLATNSSSFTASARSEDVLSSSVAVSARGQKRTHDVAADSPTTNADLPKPKSPQPPAM